MLARQHAGDKGQVATFLFLVACLFADPVPSINWWAVSVGGEDLKWHQLAYHQLMSQQGPHFSPHSKAKSNYKSTNLSVCQPYIGSATILSDNRKTID